ncbi:hypothetical protein HHI36_002527 [Cryptolaemus montrouzieri]|uniref:Uncharacterized protein n=1 Tax=Cryptolaemus montrouzieri TaxID=559131 RepID=A0ABD2PAU1_9CUCU
MPSNESKGAKEKADNKHLHESSASKVDDKTYAAKLIQKSVLDTAKQLEERKQTMNSVIDLRKSEVHNPEANKTRNPKNESVPKRKKFFSEKRRSDIIVCRASNENRFKGESAMLGYLFLE